MAKKIPGLTFADAETQRWEMTAAALREDDSHHEVIKKHREDERAKLQLLCQHFEIKDGPTKFYDLALALARELYPEKKKSGRKSKWSDMTKGALAAEIDSLVKTDDPSHGVAWACQLVAEREPWKSFLEIKESDTTTPNPAEALRKVYYDYRNTRWAELHREERAEYEREGMLERWKRRVVYFMKNRF